MIGMKRITILMILIISACLLYASPAFTYSISQVGEKSGDGSFGALTLTLGFAPVKEKHFALTEINLLLGWDRFFRGVDFSLSTPLFISSAEAFSYAFSNRVLWQPSLGFTASYRESGKRWMIGALFSPLKFTDTSFSYEFFSPYVLFTFDGGLTYGIRIMKFSAFLEVKR